MSSFANLKRNANNFEKLTQAMQPDNGFGKEDARLWYPNVDKSGNGFSVIRFLPPPPQDGDDALPWVRVFAHGFQGPTGQWYIENCNTTLGKPCLVCNHNNTLWHSGIESDKDIVRTRKRKLSYYANILVISDPQNPENEGQNRIFKFGKKIFDKLSEAMIPKFEDEKAINPFDFWEGANFKLKICNVEGYRNYDRSEFGDVKPLFGGDDAKLQALWEKEYSLMEFVDPKLFNSNEELLARFEKVIGGNSTVTETVTHAVVDKYKDLSAPVIEDDADLDYFKNLVNE